ncbi:MAG: 5'-methylthioadenosine/S-adenosylhomocysteine nucleosidase [Clostridia bacterium]|nr:5'-methylthioadenosine/S-adenosylhomocysteine nucleosidase [Clostridia bacterium]
MNFEKIGIVVADGDEYKSLRSAVEQGGYERLEILKREAHKFEIETEKGAVEVISILCGIGKVNAAAATVCLISMGCDVILNYGLSGGVSGIGRGEITIPDRFLEHDFDLQVLGYKPCEKPAQPTYIYNADDKLLAIAKAVIPNVKCGTAVTGDRFICDENVRIALADTFGAMSCDMETAAIAYVCEYADIPFLAVRRVSDDAGDDAKNAYREMNIADETMLYSYVETIIKSLI